MIGGIAVRKIVVSIQNGLLGEALTSLLQLSGEFEPYRAAVDKNKRTVSACVACNADLVLMEVTHTAHANLEGRLLEGEQIRQLVPGCKIVLLCDENVSPDIAREVVAAKKSGRIDAFYYSSVTGKYLVAALYAL
jgi:DNA-binding NarL/FixJ family response regulator